MASWSRVLPSDWMRRQTDHYLDDIKGINTKGNLLVFKYVVETRGFAQPTSRLEPQSAAGKEYLYATKYVFLSEPQKSKYTIRHVHNSLNLENDFRLFLKEVFSTMRLPSFEVKRMKSIVNDVNRSQQGQYWKNWAHFITHTEIEILYEFWLAFRDNNLVAVNPFTQRVKVYLISRFFICNTCSLSLLWACLSNLWQVSKEYITIYAYGTTASKLPSSMWGNKEEGWKELKESKHKKV